MCIRLAINYKLLHIKKVTCEFTSRTDGTSMTSSGIVPFWESRAKIYEKYVNITSNLPNVVASQILKLSEIIQRFTTLGGEIKAIDYMLLLKKIKDIEESKTYKTGYFILKPFKYLINVFKA